MLFLCGLTCRIILYNRPCTSQRGIALPLWKPLLNQQQYPARITWRFLIRAGAAAPLSNFALTRKVVLKRRMASLISVRPRSLLPRVCRNASGKLLSHPFAALTALVAVGYRHFCNSPHFYSSSLFYCSSTMAKVCAGSWSLRVLSLKSNSFMPGFCHLS